MNLSWKIMDCPKTGLEDLYIDVNLFRNNPSKNVFDAMSVLKTHYKYQKKQCIPLCCTSGEESKRREGPRGEKTCIHLYLKPKAKFKNAFYFVTISKDARSPMWCDAGREMMLGSGPHKSMKKIHKNKGCPVIHQAL